MDGVGGFNNNFSLILMLIVTIILISVNALEIVNLKYLWQKSMSSGNLFYFNKCMKYPFILKGFFVFYSLCATGSIFMLTFALVIDANYFLRKFSKSFVTFNYYVFGPGMVIPGILAFLNFDKFIYTCEIRFTINMVFNISNAFSIILCFIIGLVIWISKGLYDTFDLFSNSITRHPEGSSIIRNAFWWSVMKIGRSDNRNQNENNDQENLVNDNNNPDRIIINENYINLENERNNGFENNSLGLFRMPNNNVDEDLENNLRPVSSSNPANRQESLNNNLLNENERPSYNRNLIMERNLDYLNTLRNKNISILRNNNNREEIRDANEEIPFKDNLDPNISQLNNINNSIALDNTFNRVAIHETDERRHAN